MSTTHDRQIGLDADDRPAEASTDWLTDTETALEADMDQMRIRTFAKSASGVDRTRVLVTHDGQGVTDGADGEYTYDKAKIEFDLSITMTSENALDVIGRLERLAYTLKRLRMEH